MVSINPIMHDFGDENQCTSCNCLFLAVWQCNSRKSSTQQPEQEIETRTKNNTKKVRVLVSHYTANALGINKLFAHEKKRRKSKEKTRRKKTALEIIAEISLSLSFWLWQKGHWAYCSRAYIKAKPANKGNTNQRDEKKLCQNNHSTLLPFFLVGKNPPTLFSLTLPAQPHAT